MKRGTKVRIVNPGSVYDGYTGTVTNHHKRQECRWVRIDPGQEMAIPWDMTFNLNEMEEIE